MLALVPGLLAALTPMFDRLFPDPVERERAMAEAQGQLLAALAASDAGQTATNTVEAAHPSLFVAGWRPFFGWSAAFLTIWSLAVRDLVMGVVRLWQPEFVLPSVPTEALFTLVFGLLGLTAARSYEKHQGVSTVAIGPPTRAQVQAAKPVVMVAPARLDDLTTQAMGRYADRGGQ